MTKDYIYIKICNGFGLHKTNIILKDKYNKIVYDNITDNFGMIKIPIRNNSIYKLLVCLKYKTIIIPLIAKKNEHYCINISNNTNKSHLVTFLLLDANNPNIKIKGGEILLWQNIPSQ